MGENIDCEKLILFHDSCSIILLLLPSLLPLNCFPNVSLFIGINKDKRGVNKKNMFNLTKPKAYL